VAPSVVALLLGSAFGAAEVAGPQTATSTVPGSALRRLALDNGLRVVLEIDRRSPLAGVAVAYDAGSADDPPGRSGLAHLVEHLMFRRTAHLDDLEFYERVRGAGGAFNGVTELDRTVYYVQGPAERLEEWLWMESERMGFPRPTEKLVDIEKGVVGRELAIKDLGFRLQDIHRRALYPVGSRYHPTPDERAQVKRMTSEDVRWFLGAHYAPNRATVAIVSPFEFERVEGWVKRWFGDLRPSPFSPSTRATEPTTCPRQRITVRSADRNVAMRMRWFVADQALTPLVSVTHEYLEDRIEKKLSENDIDADAQSTAQPLRGGVEITVTVELPADERDTDVVARVRAALDAIEDDGVDEKRLDQIQRFVRVRDRRRWRSPMARAQWLARRELEGRPLVGWLQRLTEVSSDEVARLLDLMRAAPRVDMSFAYEQGAKKVKVENAEVCGA